MLTISYSFEDISLDSTQSSALSIFQLKQNGIDACHKLLLKPEEFHIDKLLKAIEDEPIVEKSEKQRSDDNISVQTVLNDVSMPRSMLSVSPDNSKAEEELISALSNLSIKHSLSYAQNELYLRSSYPKASNSTFTKTVDTISSLERPVIDDREDLQTELHLKVEEPQSEHNTEDEQAAEHCQLLTQLCKVPYGKEAIYSKLDMGFMCARDTNPVKK